MHNKHWYIEHSSLYTLKLLNRKSIEHRTLEIIIIIIMAIQWHCEVYKMKLGEALPFLFQLFFLCLPDLSHAWLYKLAVRSLNEQKTEIIEN